MSYKFSTETLSVSFGIVDPPIGEQLDNQRLRLNLSPLERQYLQLDADAVARLRRRNVITEAEAHKARARLFKTILKHAEKRKS